MGSNYKEQLKPVLQDLCRSRELKVSGNKAELVQRLEDYECDIAKVPTPPLLSKQLLYVLVLHLCMQIISCLQTLLARHMHECQLILAIMVCYTVPYIFASPRLLYLLTDLHTGLSCCAFHKSDPVLRCLQQPPHLTLDFVHLSSFILVPYCHS